MKTSVQDSHEESCVCELVVSARRTGRGNVCSKAEFQGVCVCGALSTVSGMPGYFAKSDEI